MSYKYLYETNNLVNDILNEKTEVSSDDLSKYMGAATQPGMTKASDVKKKFAGQEKRIQKQVDGYRKDLKKKEAELKKLRKTMSQFNVDHWINDNILPLNKSIDTGEWILKHLRADD